MPEPKQLPTRLGVPLGVGFVLSLLWSAFEADPLDNTFRGVELAFFSFMVGAAIGLALEHVVFRGLDGADFAPGEVLAGRALVVLTCGFLAMCGASYYNRHVPRSSPAWQVVEIDRKGRSSGRRTVHYLFVAVASREERMVVHSPAVWGELVPGGRAELRVAEGGLGYPFVSEIRRVTPAG